MISYQFKCTLLSDVIVQQSIATEGFHLGHDYIAGNKFLGIAASTLYDREDKDTLRFFHNGDVRFGNAYPSLNGARALPVPFSWYKEKEGNKKKEDKKKLGDFYIHGRKSFEKRLEQVKTGYFTEKGYTKIAQQFALKSAYDRKSRKSKDQAMYGFFSLPKHSVWSFTVKSKDLALLEKVKEALEGMKTIGRSKTAQYGLAKIAFKSKTEVSSTEIPQGEVWLYAASDCAFLDESGQATVKPLPQQLGLPPESTLNLAKSQLKTARYTQWNGYRNTPDAERMVIKQGSVWVYKVPSSFSTEKISQGIGCYRSEGLGEVLVNPCFLEADEGKLKKAWNEKSSIDKHLPKPAKDEQQSSLLTWVEEKTAQDSEQVQYEKRAKAFIATHASNYQGISKAQWGVIRSACKRFHRRSDFLDFLFSKEFGYTKTGKNEVHWRNNKRSETLKTELYSVAQQAEDPIFFEFVEYLASEMAHKHA